MISNISITPDHCLVFNCGVGSARTTFGMVVAYLVRHSIAPKVITPVTLEGAVSGSRNNFMLIDTSNNGSNKTLNLMSAIESGLTNGKTTVQFTVARSHLSCT